MEKDLKQIINAMLKQVFKVALILLAILGIMFLIAYTLLIIARIGS